MSGDRTVLGRAPFPHVKQSRAQKLALDEAIRRFDLADHPPELGQRPGARRVSAYAQRAILTAIASHANGAGYAFLKLETIGRESGYVRRTVQRSLAALEEIELVERIRMLRSPALYKEGLPRLARQGTSPNVYRLGLVLRVAAGLHDMDWSPDLPHPAPTSQIGAVSPPADGSRSARVTPCEQLVSPPAQNGARVTACSDPVSLPEMQEFSAAAPESRVTPRTKNGNSPRTGAVSQDVAPEVDGSERLIAEILELDDDLDIIERRAAETALSTWTLYELELLRDVAAEERAPFVLGAVLLDARPVREGT